MRKPAVRRSSRGSALVTVLLVIIVLTIVGLGVAYFTQMEEGLSGNARLTRAAFYSAEAGLRKGESVVSTSVGAGFSLSSLLTCSGCTPPLNVPGGGYQGIILHATDPEDSTMKDFVNQPVSVPADVVDRGRYSVYVRNNPEDPAGSDVDSDNVVSLISVGQVQAAQGRIFTKILEEQLLTGRFGSFVGGQYLTNAGGTSSGAKSRD